VRRLAIGLLIGLAGLSLLGDPAGAQPDEGDDPSTDTATDEPTGDGAADTPGASAETDGADADGSSDVAPVDVLQVSGLLDEILVAEIGAAIERSADEGSQALVLQMNSRGTIVDDDTVEALLDEVATAPVPIGLWIGPSGARLYGTGAQLVAVADVTGMAPGARIGYTGLPLDPSAADIDLGIAGEQLRSGSIGLGEARALGVFTEIPDEGVPTVTNMVQALDGYVEDGTTLVTTELVVLDDGSTRFDTVATVRFSKLSLVDQVFHTVASPPVTYLLLLAGLALLVFEFFTAGVGVAGGVGAVCVVLACTGLAVLPTRTWAAVLLVLAMLAFAVDVQVGIPRLWTGVGIAATIVGSWFLFEDLPGATLRPSWIALLAGIGGIALTFVVGMPSMVRTRFATPTIGREWMIGEQGHVVETVDPDGVVEVGGARWRARTNRATPVGVGDPIVVAAIDGITLEVEPPEGAAKDYREMRSRRPAPADDA
jgi:membrane-bound serine protease (ClpP class)